MKKNLFITGAGSGMGQLMARQALADGWAVAALDVNAAGLDALGDSAVLLKLVVDVTDMAAVTNAVEQAEQKLGPLDRVVHAAGIMPLGLLSEQSGALMHKIMAINYGGLVNVTKGALPRMLERKRGEFVAFASMVGIWPIMYMGAYSASKFAVFTFMEVLHHENIRSGVKFACVCPPAVATPLLQQARDTVYPKMLGIAPPVQPGEILESLERALERNELVVLTGTVSRVASRLRRWIPGLLWKYVHRVEGR